MIAKIKPGIATFLIGEDSEDFKYISKHFTVLNMDEKMINVIVNLKQSIVDIEEDSSYYGNIRFETSYITNANNNIIKIVLSVWNKDRGFTNKEQELLKKFARRGVKYYDI